MGLVFRINLLPVWHVPTFKHIYDFTKQQTMKIYFLKLNGCSILPMLFFRAIGYRVCFLDCSPWLRKISVLTRLSAIGLIWLNYQDYKIKSGKMVHDWTENKVRISAQICAMESFPLFESMFEKHAVLQSCIAQRVYSAIFMPMELISVMLSDTLDSPTPEKKLMWIPNTIITRSLLESYPDFSNRCPRMWIALDLFMEALGRVVARLPQFTSSFVRRFFKTQKTGCDSSQPVAEGDASKLQDVEVAYFPHQGVAFGKLFLKDQFYSSDKDSPFFREKIAHFELGGNKASTASMEYYLENNINNYGWRTLPFDKKATIGILLRFLGKTIRNRLRGMDIDLLIKQAWIIWTIQTHKRRLKLMPRLKIVLIGYEVLFPQTLCVACRLLGIKTVAIMERMYSTWWDLSLLIDHYFAVGPDAISYLKARALPGVCIHELGLVRLNNYLEADVPEIMNTIRKKYSHVVLVMDFHSEKDWFQNGRAFDNNWRNNMLFYDVILRICGDFPEAFFLLKSKDTHFIGIPFLKDVVGRMRAQHNLLVLEDQAMWTPFASVSAADIGLALHTSLADEMLALGKPVIIYDGLYEDYGIPTKVYDYGPEATAHNYSDIKDKLATFFANPKGYNARLDDLRKKLFFVPAEPVKEYLHKELQNIWNTVNDGAAA